LDWRGAGFAVNQNKTSNVWVLSIHDRTPQGLLAFDLVDILECLKETMLSHTWIAFDLDFLGGPFVTEGESLTTSALLARARSVAQTIDGTFLAYQDGPVPGLQNSMWDCDHFPRSNASLAVLAVDATLFEVYTKNDLHSPLLKSRFSDVKEENPEPYFLWE
jgi:hypothetical protein